jgi:hypothetical protein
MAAAANNVSYILRSPIVTISRYSIRIRITSYMTKGSDFSLILKLTTDTALE